jgi:ABC-type branched-subunit amino acid transport system substrate-binding protein
VHASWLSRASIAAALLALSGMTASAQQPNAKIGLFLELTGGSASTTSEASQFGVELAVKEINAAGGIGGRKLDLVVADTQTDPTVGVGEIKRLIQQDKVDFVFGPVISQIFLAAAPVLNEAKIGTIGSTGSMAITPKSAPYYFSTLINAETQAKHVAAEAGDVLKAKTVAILSDTGAQAKDFVEAIKKELQARDIKLTGSQEYQYRATDLTPQLLALRRGKPDTLLLFSSSGEDAGNAIKSLTELGWQVPVTGNWTVGAFAPIVEQIAGKEALKTVTGANYRGFTYCEGGEKPKPFLDLVAKAKAADPARAERSAMTFVALFYDATYLLKAAVEGNGQKWDGPSIAGWIEKNAKSVPSVSGIYSASDSSHFLYDANAVVAVSPGERGEAGIERRPKC